MVCRGKHCVAPPKLDAVAKKISMALSDVLRNLGHQRAIVAVDGERLLVFKAIGEPHKDVQKDIFPRGTAAPVDPDDL